MKEALKNVKLFTLILGLTAFGICGLIFLGIKLVDQEAGTNIGDYGGYISGIFGTALSLIAVILIYQTYHLQEKELKETREVLSQQQFFSLLEMLKGNTLDIVMIDKTPLGESKKYGGLDAINYIYSRYYNLFNLKDNSFNQKLIRYINKISSEDTKIKLEPLQHEGFFDDDGEYHPDYDTDKMAQAIHHWIVLDLKREKFLLEAVQKEVQGSRHETFKKLVRTIKFIWNIISKKDEELKGFYSELLISQLTQPQLILVFYTSLLHEEFSSLRPMFKDPILHDAIKPEALLRPIHLHNFRYNKAFYADNPDETFVY